MLSSSEWIYYIQTYLLWIGSFALVFYTQPMISKNQKYKIIDFMKQNHIPVLTTFVKTNETVLNNKIKLLILSLILILSMFAPALVFTFFLVMDILISDPIPEKLDNLELIILIVSWVSPPLPIIINIWWLKRILKDLQNFQNRALEELKKYDFKTFYLYIKGISFDILKWNPLTSHYRANMWLLKRKLEKYPSLSLYEKYNVYLKYAYSSVYSSRDWTKKFVGVSKDMYVVAWAKKVFETVFEKEIKTWER
ncbi:hypothetical protein ACA758_01975 [Mycoplasmopsis agassizii]|uniref:hypothetical protein n=1 Tax=Mycoplasmopsis agassizii TaxID=33922 RepID=UPI003529B4BC